MNYLTLDKDMFYSIVNMKFRDFYSSVEDLCLSEGIDIEKFNAKLEEYGFLYDEKLNKIY